MTRHAKRYELGGQCHFEKIRLKVDVASSENCTCTRVSKRSLTYYKTGLKAFFMLSFFATRLSNILYDIKCSLLNICKLKLGWRIVHAVQFMIRSISHLVNIV